jgi:hypothetical protein
MRGYGLPRIPDVESPDVADIHLYGLKTRVGGKDYHKNKKAKAASRRWLKKRARRDAKHEIQINVKYHGEKI